MGLPADLQSIDGVMVWGHNGRTYLFAGHVYWRLDDAQEKVESDYPRDMSIWQGIPHDIDAVMHWYRNGVTYFFKGTNFWRIDNRRMQATDDSPRAYQDYWFRSACGPKDTFPADFDFDVMNFSTKTDLSPLLILMSIVALMIRSHI
jgi:hypothetical protein